MTSCDAEVTWVEKVSFLSTLITRGGNSTAVPTRGARQSTSRRRLRRRHFVAVNDSSCFPNSFDLPGPIRDNGTTTTSSGRQTQTSCREGRWNGRVFSSPSGIENRSAAVADVRTVCVATTRFFDTIGGRRGRSPDAAPDGWYVIELQLPRQFCRNASHDAWPSSASVFARLAVRRRA